MSCASSASQLRQSLRELQPRRLPSRLRARLARRDRASNHRADAACGPTAATSTDRSTSSVTSTAVTTSWSICSTTLGYQVDQGDGPPLRRRKVAGRSSSVTSSTAGRASPSVLKLVMNMTRAGAALCIPGNHDTKLLKKLQGRDVKVSHGLQRRSTSSHASRQRCRRRSRTSSTSS